MAESYVNSTIAPCKDVLQIMQAQLASRSLGEFIFETLYISLLILSSVLGNSLTLYIVYKNNSLRTTPNMFVISLAVSDLMIGLLAISPALMASIRSGWYFGRGLCLFQGYSIIFTAPLSLVIIVMTSVNRFYKITRNHSYNSVFSSRKTQLMIVGAWVVCFLLPLPVMHNDIILFTPSKFVCFVDFRSKWSIYVTIIMAILIGIALIIIAYCYVNIFITISNHQKTRNIQSIQSRSNIREIKITRMMFVLVLAFGACWTPGFIVSLIDCFKETFSLPRAAYVVHTFAAGVSCGINPILYGIMNPVFRRQYLKLLKCSKTNGVNSVVPNEQTGAENRRQPFVIGN